MSPYLIRITTPAVPQAHYVAKSVMGSISQYVNDARTWKTERGALQFIGRSEDLRRRQNRGARIEVVSI